jgi:predicted dienelactone hydrolase
MLEGCTTFDYGQFKGRLDMAAAGVMGHSFGGATTVQTLSEDSRFL